jgi:tetratricopeptide (TPR) repeat protein/serine/threonine protein kinase
MTERDMFIVALQKEDPAERQAYLDQACAGQPEMRQQVEHLLSLHEGAGSFLEKPAAQSAATGAFPGAAEQAPSLEARGALVGPYKLIELIGEGGMGVVWLAQQQEPVKRVVAVKLIKTGLDSRQVIARFEAERQALALMDHANIARVLDAGATPAGRPFFVMELVKGVPITRYCDEHHLTPKQRLELFVPVCQAVQHAHQKGIIHRDLKPSNVLVALYDGMPVPKVIDFGVAKAAGQSLTDKTLVTGFGNIVGTLEYMSPEQAEINQLDIDTRSDIYSLGVLLYELLTGSPPFTQKELEKAGMLEMLRVIREQEPSKPSTKLSTAEGLPTLAANRGTEPAKLTRLVRGELDWIVMKALEKDRNRRYETANGFAMDVQRYLADEAVQACPPSVGYKLRKFARRNKAALVTAALILIAITVVAGAIGWIINDRRAQQVMTEREVDSAVTEASRMQGQSRWPEALAWVQRAEGVLAPGGGSAALQRRVQDLRRDLEMVAKLEEIRLAAAEVKDGQFDSTGKDRAYAQAFREYGMDLYTLDPKAAAERIQALGIREPVTDALYDWIIDKAHDPKREHLWAVLGLADPDPWRSAIRGAIWRGDLQGVKQLAAAPEVADLPPASAGFLALAMFDNGAPAKAVNLLRRTQTRYPANFWINHQLAAALRCMKPPQLDEAIGFFRAALALRPQSPGAHLNLGAALQDQGRLDEAIAEYQEAVRLEKDYAEAHLNLGNALWARGRLDEAIAACQEPIRLKKDLPDAHAVLGNALRDKGRVDEAIAEFREAIRLNKAYPYGHYGLGNALRDKGLRDEAIAEFREAIRLKKDYPQAHCNLAITLNAMGRRDEAIAEFREALATKEDFAEAHKAHNNLGLALQAKGQLDDAIAAYREAIRIKKDYALAHNTLAVALHEKGYLDDAIAHYLEAIRLKKDDAGAHRNLGLALRDKGRPDEAIAEYREAIRLNKDYADAHSSLGHALQDKGRLDEAIVEYREAIRLKPDQAYPHNNLGNVLRDKGRLDEAIAEFREAIRLKKDYAHGHNNLGNALLAQGRLDEAIAEFQEAIRANKDYAEAHCALGQAFCSKGQFAQALACLRRGHELGSRNPGWPHPSAQWVRDCERLVALDDKLPDLLSGKVQPADTAERLALAQVCQEHKKRYAAAARFYAEAFAAEPKLIGDQPSGLRYNAACAAALAGCARGEDAKRLNDKEHARLRLQALDWLRADLAAWRRLLENEPAKARPAVMQQMQHWQTDADFVGVRGSEALERLPAAERPDWQKLWQEVEVLRQRAAAPARPDKIEKKATPK